MFIDVWLDQLSVDERSEVLTEWEPLLPFRSKFDYQARAMGIFTSSVSFFDAAFLFLSQFLTQCEFYLAVAIPACVSFLSVWSIVFIPSLQVCFSILKKCTFYGCISTDPAGCACACILCHTFIYSVFLVGGLNSTVRFTIDKHTLEMFIPILHILCSYHLVFLLTFCFLYW